MELAASFAEQGIETTLIARENRLYSRLDSPEVSTFFAEYYRARGVVILLYQAPPRHSWAWHPERAGQHQHGNLGIR